MQIHLPGQFSPRRQPAANTTYSSGQLCTKSPPPGSHIQGVAGGAAGPLGGKGAPEQHPLLRTLSLVPAAGAGVHTGQQWQQAAALSCNTTQPDTASEPSQPCFPAVRKAVPSAHSAVRTKRERKKARPSLKAMDRIKPSPSYGSAAVQQKGASQSVSNAAC